MALEINLPEDGVVKVRIGEAHATVDLFETANRLTEIAEESIGKPTRLWHEAVAKYLAEIGLPVESITHRAADAFAQRIQEAVGDLRKKDSAVGSPA